MSENQEPYFEEPTPEDEAVMMHMIVASLAKNNNNELFVPIPPKTVFNGRIMLKMEPDGVRVIYQPTDGKGNFVVN